MDSLIEDEYCKIIDKDNNRNMEIDFDQQQSQRISTGQQGDEINLNIDENEINQKHFSLNQYQRRLEFEKEMIRITLKRYSEEYFECKQEFSMIFRSLNEIQQDIKEQMEYYFTDVNLNQDAYLRSIISKIPNGCIDYKVFYKFNRIRQLIDEAKIKICANKGNMNTKIMKNNQTIDEQNQREENRIKSSLIRDSLNGSKILKVKSYSTKIKRAFPFDFSASMKISHEKTLIINNLPPNSSKQDIANLFKHSKVINVYFHQNRFLEIQQCRAYIEFLNIQEAETAFIHQNDLSSQTVPNFTSQKLFLVKMKKEEVQIPNDINQENGEKIISNSFKQNQQFQYNSKQMQVIKGVLIKIEQLPEGTTKEEVNFSFRQLGQPFYCDIINNQKNNEMDDEKNRDFSSINQQISLSKILRKGEAIVRFQNITQCQNAIKKLLEKNKKLEIEVRKMMCPIILIEQDSECEEIYWEYVIHQKNEFRRKFYDRKMQNKKKD